MSLTPNLPEILLALGEGSMQVLLKPDNGKEETLVLELVKEGTKSWIKAHPFKTTLLAARAVTFFAPPSLFSTLLNVGFDIGVPLFGDTKSTSWMHSLIGDVAGRTIMASLRESAMGSGLGFGTLGTAALTAGSEFVTGLWGQQKTVKKVRKPRGKDGVAKKVAVKRKETVAKVPRNNTARVTKKKDTALVPKKVTVKATKKKDAVGGTRKRAVAKEKEDSTYMPGAWETEFEVEAKIVKPRKKAGKT